MKTQNELKTAVSFVDANKNKFEIDIEITYRNGYKEFTMSGSWGGGGGQIYDHIQPANDAQGGLLKLWSNYHLKNVESVTDIEEQIESTVSDIEEAEEERKGEPLTQMNEADLLELIEGETEFTGRDAELCAAFVYMFDLCQNDLQDIEIDGTDCKVQGIDYKAGDDYQMNELWDEDLDNYLEECVYPELPDNMRNYFDDDKWKDDAKMDGRAHSLNRYDGNEKSCEVNGTCYYAYRQ